VFAERQRQPMKQLVRSEPDVLVLPYVNRRFEELLIRAAHGAAGPVSSHQQIAVAIRLDAVHAGMKSQFDAKLAAAIAHYAKEFQPAYARKPVAANRDALASVNDVNVVPDFAVFDDPTERRLIALFEVRKGLAGKDYAPAESVVRPVAFDD